MFSAQDVKLKIKLLNRDNTKKYWTQIGEIKLITDKCLFVFLSAQES